MDGDDSKQLQRFFPLNISEDRNYELILPEYLQKNMFITFIYIADAFIQYDVLIF